jgi:large subunit ribosomal protein L7Ae
MTEPFACEWRGGICMAKFVKSEISKDLSDKIYEAIEIASNTGKLRKGVNETTKCIERGLAKMVILASDVVPEEVVMHLPVICNEKKVLCVEVPSKLELGKAAGLDVGTSSIAIEEMGDSKKIVDDIKRKFEGVKK